MRNKSVAKIKYYKVALKFHTNPFTVETLYNERYLSARVRGGGGGGFKANNLFSVSLSVLSPGANNFFPAANFVCPASGLPCLQLIKV